jgi:hypothetical protein
MTGSRPQNAITAGQPAPSAPELLAEALLCVERGWRVLPVVFQKKVPAVVTLQRGHQAVAGELVPFGKRGVKDATSNVELVREIWSRGRYNVGLACGVASGVVVVDVDAYKSDEVAAWLAAARTDGRLPATLERRTGSGGVHLVYALPAGLESVRTSRREYGVDVQGDDTYVVWAGVNAKGPYEAVNDLPIALAPAWLIETRPEARAKRLGKTTAPKTAPKTAAKIRLGAAGSWPDEPLLVRLHRAAGLPIGERRETSEGTPMWFVPCPLESLHSEQGAGGCNSDTAIIGGSPTGMFSCRHTTHGGHGELTTEDALTWFRERHRAAYYAALGDSTLPAEGAPATVDAENLTELADFFSEALNADEPALHVLRITAGAGKTGAALPAAVGLAKGGTRRVTIVVPTHRLGKEIEERLARQGAAPTAVWRPVSLAHESSACKVKPLARALATIGPSPRAVLCGKCPHRADCPEAAGSTKDASARPLRILQHAAVSGAFAEAGKQDVVLVDELPDMTRKLVVTPQTLDAMVSLRPYVDGATFNAVARVHAALIGAVDVAVEGMSLRNLLSAGGGPNDEPADVEPLLEALRGKIEVNRAKVAKSAAYVIRNGRGNDRSLTEIANALELLRALQCAAKQPDAALVHQGEDWGLELVYVAPWLDEASEAAKRGAAVVVMSATVPVERLRTGASVPVRAKVLHVADAPGIRRVWVQNASASRKRWCASGGRAHAKNLRGALYDVACELQKAAARSVLVVSFKRLVPALQAAFAEATEGGSPELVPENLAAWLREGGQVEFLWFGAVEGVDDYREVDAVVTLGDPRVNVNASEHAGAALGLEEGEHGDDACASHLEQAWGRLRPVYRGGARGLILHVGSVEPDVSRAPQWVGARVIGASPAALDPARLDPTLSNRVNARLLGVNEATVRRARKRLGQQQGAQGREERGAFQMAEGAAESLREANSPALAECAAPETAAPCPSVTTGPNLDEPSQLAALVFPGESCRAAAARLGVHHLRIWRALRFSSRQLAHDPSLPRQPLDDGDDAST